jgi:hypothetical protein
MSAVLVVLVTAAGAALTSFHRRRRKLLVVAGHHRLYPGRANRSLEGRQEDLAQGARRYHGRGGVASAFGLTVPSQMFGRRHHMDTVDGRICRVATSLESHDGGRAQTTDQEGILAVGLFDAAPASIARDIEHRRQDLFHTPRAHLACGHGEHLFHQRRIEGRGQGDSVQQIFGVAEVTADFFYQKLDNLIDYDAAGFTVNVGHFATKGLEVELKTNDVHGARLMGSYTHLLCEADDPGITPQDFGSVSGNYAWKRVTLNISSTFHGTSQQRANDAYGGSSCPLPEEGVRPSECQVAGRSRQERSRFWNSGKLVRLSLSTHRAWTDLLLARPYVPPGPRQRFLRTRWKSGRGPRGGIQGTT